MDRATRWIACSTLVGLGFYATAAKAVPPETAQRSSSLNSAASVDSRSSSKRTVRSQTAALDYKSLLQQARQALERGDLDSAEFYARQAEAVQGRKGLLSRVTSKDSPKKILSDVAEARVRQQSTGGDALQRQVEQQLYGGPSDTGGQKQHAQRLMIEARALMAQGQYTEATQRAAAAKQIRTTYAPGELTPDDVLREIVAQRRQAEGAVPLVDPLNLSPSGALTAAPTAAAPGFDAAAVRPTTPATPEAMLQEARRQLAYGEVTEARRLAQQAAVVRPQNVSPFSDTPDAVLRDAAEYEQLESASLTQDDEAVQRRQYNWLVEQGRRLKNQGDYDLAEQMAEGAAEMAPTDRSSPAHKLLEQIAAERAGKTATGGTIRLTSQDAPAASSAGGQWHSPGAATADSVPAELPDLAATVADEASAAEASTAAPETGTARVTTSEAVPTYDVTPQVRQRYANLSARDLYNQGVDRMSRQDHAWAIAFFIMALDKKDQLDPTTQQQIQDHLSALYPKVRAATSSSTVKTAAHQQPDTLSTAEGNEQLRLRKLEAETLRALQEADRLRDTRPQQALETLRRSKTVLEQAGGGDPKIAGLTRRVDHRIAEIERYREQHGARLDLLEQNATTEEQIRREQEREIAVQKELTELVDQFNRLWDQGRFAEANLIAQKADALAPGEPVVQVMVEKAKIRHNLKVQEDLQDAKEAGFLSTLAEVEATLTNTVGDDPIRYPDAQTWQDLVKRRGRGESRYNVNRSEKELQIERSLGNNVSLKYQQSPLSAVLADLGAQAGINVVVDAEGLAEAGVDPSTPVTIEADGIMLRSALNLILQQVHLIWVIRDEVLKVTSEARGRGELLPVVYPVGDLVLPIPNFTPNGSSMGSILGQFAGNSSLGGTPIAQARPVSSGLNSTVNLASDVMAQLNAGGAAGAGATAPTFPPFAPGEDFPAAGAGANADFDSLIDLIKETIDPDSWDDQGGPGTIREFALNLSIIVTQTQEVHDQIASLLEQLRRLLDLQLAIEVRFVTVTDNFFERIGIDFDFDINDHADFPFQIFGRPDPTAGTVFSDPAGAGEFGGASAPARDYQDRDHYQGTQAVGMAAPGIFSVDLDIPFRQNSFNIGVPQFGGFTPDAGAQMGFAILSDIEAFFFINAAQADRRTNIVQAPKIVLFNGQFGIIVDFAARPFVSSVIPLIGAGAIGFQPQIVTINTGVFMFAQGIISADRRHVRLNVIPIFSQLGEVFTFTTNLAAVGGGGGLGGGGNAINTPVTLQLPVQTQTIVITTVNVPDGGTVLLGGVKRISEGRTEAGVPVLNKLPYINRLFKNVGTGRDTQSLMLMVTPRIIIGEEEEELQGTATF